MRGSLQIIGIAAAGAMLVATPAFSQAHSDEPTLDPMLFGKTQQQRDDERQLEDAGFRADQNLEQIDDPNLDPLLFGPSQAELEEDRNATTVTLGPEDGNRGFFSGLTYLIPDETNLSLGVGPVYEPDYFGSDDYHFDIDPQVYVKFRNFVFLDNDGADFALLGFSNFRFGPTLRIKGKRDQDDNPALLGLGDVGTTFEFGGFAATTFRKRYAFKFKARHGIKTGHRGTVVDAYFNALLFRAGPVSVAAGAQGTWIGDNYADAYFTVTPEQSTRSGGALSEYTAGRGFRDVGGSVTAYINVFDRWSVNPYATYQYIFNEYAESPIINDFGSRDQFTVGFHIMREFTF